MGLNWAAALDNFSKGMGQIAQVKYAEFMRQDENARREREREMDYKRQMNLERFRIKAAQDSQQAGFTHAERLHSETMDYNRTRAEADDKYRMESLANQRAQINASAAESTARLKLLEEQAGYAKDDRELQQQLSVWKIPQEAAQSQLSALFDQRQEIIKNTMEGVVPNTAEVDAMIKTQQQKLEAAVNGQVDFMIRSEHIKMDQETRDRYDSLGNQGISALERLQRATNPVLAPAPDQNQFIPTGEGAPGQALGNQDPSERRIGGTVVPAAREQAPAPKFNVPPGLRVPGAEPPQDYTIGGITPTGDYAVGGLGENGKQVISKWDKFYLTNGASMAAGDAALAGGGSTRDIGASVSVAIRSLSTAAQQEVTRARSAADLSPTTIDELRTKNYNPDTLIGYLRRNG